jgi:hypothetical protein
LKKPQALIGLLAALGTAIGVLVAIVGLPYGRADYTAFAGLYHGGTPATGFHAAIDCDASSVATVESACAYNNTQASFDAAVTVGNNTGAPATIFAFNFEVTNNNTAAINPLLGVDANLNANPDFNDPTLGTGPDWSCSLPTPDEDTGEDGPGTSTSFLSCFNGSPSPALPPFPAPHVVLALVHYDIVANGVALLGLEDFALGDDDGVEVMSCNPVITTAGQCFGAQVTIQDPPPADTATPTNTPEPTATFTATPTATNTPLGASVVKIPESCVAGGGDPDNCDPLIPAANLWLCVTGPCAGPGEGNLIVFEYASNILTGDQNGDTVADGLGAYEFSVEYDNFVIQSVNPSDVVFAPLGSVNPYPGGADGVLDGEGAARGPANCSFSLIFENVVHFGCVTSGQTPGPTGNMDLARLNLIPHPDLTNDIFPGNDNGVVTVLKDNGCETVDIFGHPTTGSVNGGLTPVCGDLAVTVRILEGDLNLDCVVDVQDQQLIAFRYGAFFGSLLYSQWYDLEPNLHDLDIDIKDIQKVFGRDGSTCQNPIGPQPPMGPPAPFGN